jgi:hypothetical protein
MVAPVLSGTTSLVLTARDVIQFALHKLAVMPIGADLDINEIQPALLELNVMLKDWQTKGPFLFCNTGAVQPLTSGTASYDLATNPLRIVECRYRNAAGTDLFMVRFSRMQYETLPDKSSVGTPTQYYFDPQADSGTLYVWPVMAAVNGDSIAYTYQRRFQVCTSLNNLIDVPEEWLGTVGYCLAERLIPNYGITGETAARVERSAATLARAAKAFDRPAFVTFQPQYRPRR